MPSRKMLAIGLLSLPVGPTLVTLVLCVILFHPVPTVAVLLICSFLFTTLFPGKRSRTAVAMRSQCMQASSSLSTSRPAPTPEAVFEEPKVPVGIDVGGQMLM